MLSRPPTSLLRYVMCRFSLRVQQFEVISDWSTRRDLVHVVSLVDEE